MYGYYGRTASPPPGSGTNGRGAWATTPAPQFSVDSDQQAASSAGAGTSESSGAPSKTTAAGGVDGSEEFVPDFGFPQGLVAPSTVRQHMMMVGTARTAVRSPQVSGGGIVFVGFSSCDVFCRACKDVGATHSFAKCNATVHDVALETLVLEEKDSKKKSQQYGSTIML